MLFKMKGTAAFSFVILGVILMLYLNTERKQIHHYSWI